MSRWETGASVPKADRLPVSAEVLDFDSRLVTALPTRGVFRRPAAGGRVPVRERTTKLTQAGLYLGGLGALSMPLQRRDEQVRGAV